MSDKSMDFGKICTIEFSKSSMEDISVPLIFNPRLQISKGGLTTKVL